MLQTGKDCSAGGGELIHLKAGTGAVHLNFNFYILEIILLNWTAMTVKLFFHPYMILAK